MTETEQRRQPVALGPLASEVVERRVEWLHPGLIALGKLHDVAGDPGSGKTTFLMDVVARTTRGEPLFAGDPFEPARALILSAEDDAEDTLVPRLREAGADLSMVRIMPAALAGPDGLRPVTFPDDVRLIEGQVDVDRAKLVVVDPITAFLADRIDSHKDASVRKALAEIGGMAVRTGAAIVLVRHLNKSSAEANALYRSGGSIAFVAAARVAFLIGIDPTDQGPVAERRRVMAAVKCNLAPLPPSRAFRLCAGEGAETAHVEWISAPCGLSANDLLRPRRSRHADALEEAESFLKDRLSEGARPSAAIDGEAKALGISDGTLRRARERLRIASFRKEFGGPWFVKLSRDEASL